MSKKLSTKSFDTQANRPLNRRALNTSLLLFTVTISGGAVMILELLGTRIIAPYYGVSLYVWSSLIAVTMIALAVGYYLGGYLSDRYPKFRLTHIFIFAGFATILIPILSGSVMQLTNPLGIRMGAFISALILFFLPLTALAMVGPMVIKLATSTIDEVGKSAGSVYAVSTLGSVVATLILGFYLLPVFGTRSIISAVSFVLLALAILLMVCDKEGFGKPFSSFPIVICAVILGFSYLTGTAHQNHNQSIQGYSVQHSEESAYGWIRVVDDQLKGIRMLLSDASLLSAVSLSDGQTLLTYQSIIGQLPLLRANPTNALLIGLGGGHIARDFKAKGMITDTIEIDPAVADAALNYFHFKPTGEFIVGDARYEIQKLNKRYDFIIHDCFTGGSEPIHMLTFEMLSQLKALLTEQGILILNYAGYTQGEGTKAVASVYKTLHQVFPHIRTFITEKTELTDFIFIASNGELTLDEKTKDPRIQWLLGHQYTLNENQGIVITDDFNPMDSMQVRKAEAYRKVFIERVAKELLVL